MLKISVFCLPDAIIALPFNDDMEIGKDSVLIPTRSFNKDTTKMPAWIFITSEELETDSDDYNHLKEKFVGFIESDEYDDDWYMMRLQTVITSAFRNLEADPNFKVKSGS
jgi:hypothetical protein